MGWMTIKRLRHFLYSGKHSDFINLTAFDGCPELRKHYHCINLQEISGDPNRSTTVFYLTSAADHVCFELCIMAES